MNKNRWQPIATAPKDGTIIDVWTGDDGGGRLADVRWVNEPRKNIPHPDCVVDGWKAFGFNPYTKYNDEFFKHWRMTDVPDENSDLNPYVFEARVDTMFSQETYYMYIESKKTKEEVFDFINKHMIINGNLGHVVITFPVGEILMLQSYNLSLSKVHTLEEWVASSTLDFGLDKNIIKHVASE